MSAASEVMNTTVTAAVSSGLFARSAKAPSPITVSTSTITAVARACG